MDLTYTFSGLIRDIVLKTTMYMRHYVGNVIDNNDPDKKGKVLVEIPELDWYGEQAAWCVPRFLHEVKIPHIGEPVEVYFINNDMNRPVYMALATDFEKGFSKNHSGKPTEVYIYENPKTGHGIYYDEAKKELKIDAQTILMGKDAVEAMVLGTQLNAYLTTLVTTVNSLLGSKLDGGGSPGTLTPPSGILSTITKVK